MTIEIRPYDPESPSDRYQFLDTLVRLHLQHLTHAAPFRREWVDGAWALAKHQEAAARSTRAS